MTLGQLREAEPPGLLGVFRAEVGEGRRVGAWGWALYRQETKEQLPPPAKSVLK